eukprot:23244-Chlamydomonas_euryale.AAC.1
MAEEPQVEAGEPPLLVETPKSGPVVRSKRHSHLAATANANARAALWWFLRSASCAYMLHVQHACCTICNHGAWDPTAPVRVRVKEAHRIPLKPILNCHALDAWLQDFSLEPRQQWDVPSEVAPAVKTAM